MALMDIGNLVLIGRGEHIGKLAKLDGKEKLPGNFGRNNDRFMYTLQILDEQVDPHLKKSNHAPTKFIQIEADGDDEHVKVYNCSNLQVLKSLERDYVNKVGSGDARFRYSFRRDFKRLTHEDFPFFD